MERREDRWRDEEINGDKDLKRQKDEWRVGGTGERWRDKGREDRLRDGGKETEGRRDCEIDGVTKRRTDEGRRKGKRKKHKRRRRKDIKRRKRKLKKCLEKKRLRKT